MNPLHLADYYKVGHVFQYPENTELIFSNFTPRSSRIEGVDEVVFFGLQYFVMHYLQDVWDQEFFKRPKEEVVAAYRNRTTSSGLPVDTSHIEALHDLGYLPIEIWALPEGSVVPLRVPMLVLWNTKPEFYWLTNYLETVLSSVLWGPCTSATIARRYRKYLDEVAERTGGPAEFVPFQGHDFSMRGMYGMEASVLSGAAHLTSFQGTDTIAAIDFAERYYCADSSQELIGGSVPATEHSVMCAAGQTGEQDTFERLITKVYPDGIVSIVSDTWDYWTVLTKYLPALKDQVLARDGKVVIRPDSGDPVKIIVGDPDAEPGSPAHKGSFEVLWETFGGEVNAWGFKALDPHIGLIYGDSITYDRCVAICEGLIAKGFVPSLVFGIGSYTYQYNTRDTFGFAVKATYAEIDGKGHDIFKDPATDSGVKKSATGLLAVYKEKSGYTLREQSTWRAVKSCAFERVFVDGHMARYERLADIRARLEEQA